MNLRRADRPADARYRCVFDADAFGDGLPEGAARASAGPDQRLASPARRFATRQVITVRLPLGDVR